MAKRTLAASQLSSATAPATETSVCFSLVNEVQRPSIDSEQQVCLSSEEETPPPSPPQLNGSMNTCDVTRAPSEAPEWNFVCPFCCSARLTDPVELHAPAAGDVCCDGGGHAAQQERHCLACRACAEKWRTAVCVLEDASQSASSLACPLCEYVTAVSSQSSHGTDAPFRSPSVSPQDTEAIRNCYTGLLSRSEQRGGTSTSATSFSAATSTTTTYCGVCEEQKATCVCVQCDFGLCAACHQATHTKGKFKLHEVVGLDQARCRDQQKCSEHVGMSLDLYCETCATCVCVTCCFGGAHRGHDVSPLADVAQRTAEVLTDGAQELSDMVQRATSARDELADLGPQYDAKVAAVEADVVRCFSSLRRVLQEREDALVAQLHHAASDVRGRSTRLRSAADAIADLLRSASAQLEGFQAAVSPATLMRVAPQLHERQAWTLRVASRLAEEAAATVEGWSYQLGEEGPNGCRMACFDMLNAQTLNVQGIRQYQQVLSDLGRLEVSADLQPPTVRSSAMDDSDADQQEGGEEEMSVGEMVDEDERISSVANNMDKSVAGPIVEVQPETPTPLPAHRNERSRSLSTSSHMTAAVVDAAGSVAATVSSRGFSDANEDDVPRLRHSHTSNAASSFSSSVATTSTAESSRANRATEMHVVSKHGGCRVGSHDRSSAGATSVSRVVALRSATSSATRASQPRSLVISGNLRDDGSAPLPAPSRPTSQVRAAIEALERREVESYSASVPSSSSSARVQLARDTMPFRVAMPQKRVLSRDRSDDAQRWEGSVVSGASSSTWRPLKLQRTSVMRDSALADVAARVSSLSPAPPPVSGSGGGVPSTWQTGAASRLSLFSEADVGKPIRNNGVSPVRGLVGDGAIGEEQQRGTVRRRTTGLHLEL